MQLNINLLYGGFEKWFHLVELKDQIEVEFHQHILTPKNI